MEHINRFLKSTKPEVLCISGDWGVGKTFLWNTVLNEVTSKDELGLKEYSYASLFGVDSLEALKLTIYENALSLKKHIGADALNKLRPRKYRKLAELVPKIGDAIEKLNALYFSLVKKQIICIDDLERRSKDLEVKDVLGLISFLKEQRGCKVVLLLNDNELRDEGAQQFKDYFEKTVDIHLKLKPDLQDSVKIALPTDDDISKTLSEHCVALDISNIRVIHKLERFVRDIDPQLTQFDARVRKQVAHSLTLLCYGHFQPTIAPSIEFLKKRTGMTSMLKLNEGENNEDDEESKTRQAAWNALLDVYQFGSMDELDHELLKSIEVGYFNPVEIRQHAEALHNKYELERLDGSFEDTWNLYHDSFDNNQDVVLDAMYASFNQSLKTISLTNMDSTIRLFRELGRDAQAEELLKRYLDDRSADRKFWDLDEHPFGDNVRDPDVVAAIRAKFASLDATNVDAKNVLEQVGSNKGWNMEDMNALAQLPVEAFVKLFKETKGRELRRVINGALSTDRFANPPESMQKMTANAKKALEQIGEESKINARRVERYNIKIASKADGNETEENA